MYHTLTHWYHLYSVGVLWGARLTANPSYVTTLTTVEALSILEWAILGGVKLTTLVALSLTGKLFSLSIGDCSKLSVFLCGSDHY